MRNLFIIILFSLGLSSLLGQTPYSTGLILDDEAYETLPREPRFAGSKYSDLPFEVDLRPFCPEIGNQGRIQSCVGWALGYGALTIQRAIFHNLTNKALITRNANSALFIYNQIKQNDDCNSGSRMSDAIKFLQENGDCLSSKFDTDADDCSKTPDIRLQQEAENFAVTDFMTLFSVEEDPIVKIFKIQRALANKQPVVVGLNITQNFFTLHGMQTWNPKIGNQTKVGGHAMVVVGYNEARSAFLLMNSWGKEWGDEGFIWVKYSDFASRCKYGYVLHYTEKNVGPPPTNVVAANTTTTTTNTTTNPMPNRAAANNESPISGNFAFRFLEGWEDDKPVMKDADVTFNGNYYRVNRTDWELGQFFQLVTTAAANNEYIYVFSVDGEGKSNIHWPRQEKLNEKFAGMNESALVTTSGAEIYIPGIDRGLRLSKKGVEHLVILFSKETIDNVKEISEYMETQKEDFYNNLTFILGDYLVPNGAIDFNPNQISFSTKSAKGEIVPLVVELETK